MAKVTKRTVRRRRERKNIEKGAAHIRGKSAYTIVKALENRYLFSSERAKPAPAHSALLAM